MKKQSSKIFFQKYRFYFVTTIFFIAVIFLFYRMLELTLFDRAFLSGQGKARSIRVINTPAFRGMIVDRNNSPLAVSTPVDSVWANPKDIELSQENLTQLSQLLKLPAAEIEKQINSHKSKQFIYLKRGVTPDIADQVKALLIPGVYLQREYRRYYPEGEVASQLIGITNIDDQGQEGLELAYNSWLDGTPGRERVIQDLHGQVVASLGEMQKQKPGHDLKLSIDRRIQFIAYQAIKEAAQKFQAKSASVVVMDVKTGEVLAMANTPSFNPNDKNQAFNSGFKNRAVTDVFEPGSTIKAFSITSALDSGKYTPETEVNTNPGYFKVGRNWVRDELNYGDLDVTGVLQKSSNVGVAKMTISLPGDQLWSVLNRVGFAQRTDSGFPGEASGTLIHQTNWKPFTLSTLAFGYGISVTTLQLAHAYSAIANHGKLVPVTLLKRNKPVKGEQVLNKSTTNEMLAMLESVVAPGGTGQRARVPGYRVAGKTGTARLAGPNGYYQHRYVGSFVGIAPVSNPRIVVAVVIMDPQGKEYYGGLIAAPAFAKVMSSAMRILNIAPDQIVKPKAVKNDGNVVLD